MDIYIAAMSLLLFSHQLCPALCVTPWTAAYQASLSSTISWNLFKLMSIELVMPSNHLTLCRPLLLPSIFWGSFPMSWLDPSGGQTIGASASASVLPMNIQGWFPLRLTGLTSLLSRGLSRVFSNTTVQKHQFFGTQPFLWPNSHIRTYLLEKPKTKNYWTFVSKVMYLFFNMLSSS